MPDSKVAPDTVPRSPCLSSMVYTAGSLTWLLTESPGSSGGWMLADCGRNGTLLVGPLLTSTQNQVKSRVGIVRTSNIVYVELDCGPGSQFSSGTALFAGSCNRLLRNLQVGQEIVLGGFSWAGNAGVFAIKNVIAVQPQKGGSEIVPTAVRVGLAEVERPVHFGGRVPRLVDESSSRGLVELASLDADFFRRANSFRLIGGGVGASPVRLQVLRQGVSPPLDVTGSRRQPVAAATELAEPLLQASTIEQMCLQDSGASMGERAPTGGAASKSSFTEAVQVGALARVVGPAPVGARADIFAAVGSAVRIAGFDWTGNSGIFMLAGALNIQQQQTSNLTSAIERQRRGNRGSNTEIQSYPGQNFDTWCLLLRDLPPRSIFRPSHLYGEATLTATIRVAGTHEESGGETHLQGSAHSGVERPIVPLGSATIDAVTGCGGVSDSFVGSYCGGGGKLRNALRSIRLGLVFILPSRISGASVTPHYPQLEACLGRQSSTEPIVDNRCDVVLGGLATPGPGGAGTLVGIRGTVGLIAPRGTQPIIGQRDLSRTASTAGRLGSTCSAYWAFADSLASGASIARRSFTWLQECCRNSEDEKDSSNISRTRQKLVTPSLGPLQGGAWIIVEGEELGTAFHGHLQGADQTACSSPNGFKCKNPPTQAGTSHFNSTTHLSVLVGGKQCSLSQVLWVSELNAQPWASVVCVTPAGEKAGGVNVVVRLGDDSTDGTEVANSSLISWTAIHAGRYSYHGSPVGTKTKLERIGAAEEELAALVRMKDWHGRSGIKAIVQAAKVAIAREKLNRDGVSACAYNCSGHGQCTQKGIRGHMYCQCDIGWMGTWCEWPLLPCSRAFDYRESSNRSSEYDSEDPCKPHGLCDSSRGACRCDEETVALASTKDPPDNTESASVRVEWFGVACQNRQCPRDCSGHGTCLASEGGECNCDPGYAGIDCSTTLSGATQELKPADDLVSTIGEWIGDKPVLPGERPRDLRAVPTADSAARAWVGADLHPTSLERLAIMMGRNLFPCAIQATRTSADMSLDVLSSTGMPPGQFADVDTDTSGCISAAEFVRASRTILGNAVNAVLEEYLNGIDADSNGELSAWELAASRVLAIEESSGGGLLPGAASQTRYAALAASNMRTFISDGLGVMPRAHVLAQVAKATQTARTALISSSDNYRWQNASQLLGVMETQRALLLQSGPDDSSDGWVQTGPDLLAHGADIALGAPAEQHATVPLDGVVVADAPAGWILGARHLESTQGGKDARRPAASRIAMKSVVPAHEQVQAGDLTLLSIGPPLVVQSLVGTLLVVESPRGAQLALPRGTLLPLLKVPHSPRMPLRLEGEISFALGGSFANYVLADIARSACQAARVGAILDFSGGAAVARSFRSGETPLLGSARDMGLAAFARVSWKQCSGSRPTLGLVQGSLLGDLVGIQKRLKVLRKERGAESQSIWLTGVVAFQRRAQQSVSAIQPLPIAVKLLVGPTPVSPKSGIAYNTSSSEGSGGDVIQAVGTRWTFEVVTPQQSTLHDWERLSVSALARLGKDAQQFRAAGPTESESVSKLRAQLGVVGGLYELPVYKLARLAQSLLHVGDIVGLASPVGPCIVEHAGDHTLDLMPVSQLDSIRSGTSIPLSPSERTKLQFSGGRVFRVGPGAFQLVSTSQHALAGSKQSLVVDTEFFVADSRQCQATTVSHSEMEAAGALLTSPECEGHLAAMQSGRMVANSFTPAKITSLDVAQVQSPFGPIVSAVLQVDAEMPGEPGACEARLGYSAHSYSMTSASAGLPSRMSVVRPVAGRWVYLPGFWRQKVLRSTRTGQNTDINAVEFEFGGKGAPLFVAVSDSVLVYRAGSMRQERGNVTAVWDSGMTVSLGVESDTSVFLSRAASGTDSLVAKQVWGSRTSASAFSSSTTGSNPHSSIFGEPFGWHSALVAKRSSANLMGHLQAKNAGTKNDTRTGGLLCASLPSRGVLAVALAGAHAAISSSLLEGMEAAGDDTFFWRNARPWLESKKIVKLVNRMQGPRQLTWETTGSLLSLGSGQAGPSSVLGAAFADDVATLASMTVGAVERAASGSTIDGRLTVAEAVKGLTGPLCLANESPLVSAAPCAQAAVFGLGPPALFVAAFWPTDRENFLWCSASGTVSDQATVRLAAVPNDCALFGALENPEISPPPRIEETDSRVGNPSISHDEPGTSSRLGGVKFGASSREGASGRRRRSNGGARSSQGDSLAIGGDTQDFGRGRGERRADIGRSSGSFSSFSSSGSGGGSGGFPDDPDVPSFPPRPALEPYKDKPHDVMPGFFYFPSPFIWCPMFPPFLIPFCPTPIPQINILLKMMIPGVMRPPIDMILADFMVGVDATQTIFLCIFPMMDAGGARRGPPGLLQLRSGSTIDQNTSGDTVPPAQCRAKPVPERIGEARSDQWALGHAASTALVQLDVAHIEEFYVADRQQAASHAGVSQSSGMHMGLVTPALKKQLAAAVAHPIANDVAAVIASSVHLQSHRPLVARLAGAVRSEVTTACVQDIIQGIGRSGAVAMSGGLVSSIGREGNVLGRDLRVATPASAVPVLAQAVPVAVVRGLQVHGGALDLEACAECDALGGKGACVRCQAAKFDLPRSVATKWATVLSERLASALVRALARRMHLGEDGDE